MYCATVRRQQDDEDDDDTTTTFNFKKQIITRLSPNLKPTTRECVHLVKRGHFRSRDKDSGHIIRPAVDENPQAARKLHGCVFYIIYIFYSPEMVAAKKRNTKKSKKYTNIKSESTKNQ